jgi:hypothetical protein
MTYAEHINKLQTLIASLETAQASAAYWGLTAAAMSINEARKQLILDMTRARDYADEHMAHGQDIA